jgi:hypothetical protein
VHIRVVPFNNMKLGRHLYAKIVLSTEMNFDTIFHLQKNNDDAGQSRVLPDYIFSLGKKSCPEYA